MLGFVQRFQPALVSRVKLYTRAKPIFDEYGITSELEKALRPKVWLKTGGHIVINQTEALVAIDVNTGKYVGKSNRLEDTIVKTNTDAIKEIVRQIRLRDLGGIIVVDFIDMDERKNRQRVMQVLEEAMRADRAPYKILQFNDFGLVAITRKRVKQSLERTLCVPCPYCEGSGYVKSVQTVIGEILVEAQKIARALEGGSVMLRVNPEVAKVSEVQPEFVPAGNRRNPGPHGVSKERPSPPPGEVRLSIVGQARSLRRPRRPPFGGGPLIGPRRPAGIRIDGFQIVPQGHLPRRTRRAFRNHSVQDRFEEAPVLIKPSLIGRSKCALDGLLRRGSH